MTQVTVADRTVYDTDEWLAAWSRSTVERLRPADCHRPLLYRLEYSPFWHGYEIDTGLGPIWDRPVLTTGSLYAGYGPGYLAEHPDEVAALMDHAAGQMAGTCGLLVLNLPLEAALQWALVRPPDGMVRLDLAYHRVIGAGRDPIVGDVDRHERHDWRRRWRRATEKGVRLVEETDPAPERVDEVVALANGSALRHGWPVLYDRATAMAVLGVPGARLLRADWHGRTVAGFVALEHDRRLYLWAGGMDHTVVREVSPYLFVLYELLRMGPERGWERLEFGKGNDAFKRRYGFTGVELWSLWYAADPADVAVYRPKLAALHQKLGAFQGL
ncbi:GNAT family N-acetyltransferase [Thermoactinospora rubra]|uniref:GNAT family N-acetyltransferase n=1 Tax=Thermoactinospora rubra TaxID=1088767 RepID=UPI000A0F740E|nr:GNAT family N-acetyltransferase [Thermoactinospora rubra]